ncbi:MAG: hypothetical protein R8M45_03840 [Ghiorsea sp.]
MGIFNSSSLAQLVQGKPEWHEGMSALKGDTYLRPNRYLVDITIPASSKAGIDQKALKEIRYSCVNAKIPGISFNTIDKRDGVPAARKRPNDVTYNEMSLTYRLTSILKERAVFDAWFKSIYNSKKHSFAFPDTYMGTIDIHTYNISINATSHFRLVDIYPTSISDISLAYTDDSSIGTVDIGFSYTRNDTISVKGGAPSWFEDKSIKLAKGINNAAQTALDTVSGLF